MKQKEKFYQYVSIDEYPNWSYVEVSGEHSTYYSATFLEYFLALFSLPVEFVYAGH